MAACHDVCGFIVGLLIFAAVIVCLVVGYTRGRLWAITFPQDEKGLYCGRDNGEILEWLDSQGQWEAENGSFDLKDLRDKPVLFMDVAGWLSDDVNVTLKCLTSCPTGTDEDFAKAFLGICAEESKLDGACPYPTEKVLNRCIPNPEILSDELKANLSILVDAFSSVLFAIPGFGVGLMRVQTYWKEIVISSCVSLVVAAIWIVLLRCLTKCVLYCVALLVPLLLIAAGVWVWIYGQDAVKIDDVWPPRYCAIAIWVVAAVALLIVIFLWSRISKAAAVVAIASKALFANCGSLLTPVVAIVVLIGFWVLAFVAGILVYSVHTFTIRWEEVKFFGENGPKLRFRDDEKNIQYALIFILVFVIYISVHVYFQSYYAQSASISDWYFAGGGQSNCCGCLYGYWLAWTKGMGTITLSALVMTPVYILIALCEYVDYKQKQNPAAIGIFAKFLIKCMKCCLWCFEKCLRWLNRSLLTVSQVYNLSWCSAFKRTADLLMGDVILVALFNGIAMFMMFLSKFAVALITVGLFMLYIRHVPEVPEPHWLLPACCVFILAYLVAAVFLNLFENFMDIVFMCFLADEDVTNHGSLRSLYIESDSKMTFFVREVKSAATDAADMDYQRGSGG